jgi:ACS family hexuronate transporter-like MFS transporter
VRSLAGRPSAVLVLTTGLLASTAGIQSVPGALGPLIEADLGINQASLGLLAAALTGGMALGLAPGGFLSDRFSERTIMSLGVASAGVAVLIASFATSFPIIAVLFLIASIGAAFAATGGPKTIIKWFAPNRRGTAMGVRQTGVPIGGMLASVLLPSIALATDWRVAVRCVAAVAMVAAFSFWFFYRDPEGAAGSDPTANQPSILRSRRFLAATGCAFTLQASQACTLTYLVVDLHQTLGLSAAVAALFLATSQVGAIAGRVSWGAIGDLIGNRRALSSVAAVAATCCLLMSTVDPHSNVIAVGALCLVLGMAAMSWNAVYISLVTAMAPRRSTGSSLGTGLSVVLVGFMVAPLFGRVADVAHSFRPAWIALAALVLVGFGLSFLARTPRPEPALR